MQLKIFVVYGRVIQFVSANLDGIMLFLPHIEAIISKSSRMLGFIKRNSRDFRERLERVQHNFIRYAVRRLPWRVWPLPV
jgi:hypothetical protein